MDPTELGTNFSSIKCQKCSTGYFLPVNPTEKYSQWKCGGCNASANYSDICGFVCKIKAMRDAILDKRTSSKSRLEAISRLENLLRDNTKTALHPNHWLVIDIEFNLLQLIVASISSGEVAKTRGDYFENANEMVLTRRLIDLCQHCLSIANVIQPGFNIYRGKT